MKTVVLLAAVLALCVPAFSEVDPNDPNLAVLVYSVKADISVVDFNDESFTSAEFGKSKVDGYVLNRFWRSDLDPVSGGSDNQAMFILLDKQAKRYVVVSEADEDNHVEFYFTSGPGDPTPIFSIINKNGKDTGQDYIWATLYVRMEDPNSSDDFFRLDAWDGVTQLTSSVIESPNTKIPVPKNIKFGSAEAESEINLSYGYKTAVSAMIDSKYTKLANDNNWSVRVAAVMVISDLEEKGWSVESAAEYFNWNDTP
jgi:hypothetical protein